MESVFQFLFKYKWFLFQRGKLSFESMLPGWILLALVAGCGSAVFLLYRNRLRVGKERAPPRAPFP